MDWNNLITELENLSLFELGCLARAAWDLADDPQRIAQARALLKPGIEVEYWDSKGRQFVRALILELNRTTALLQNVEDKVRWTMPLIFIVPPNTEPIVPPAPRLPKSEWSVGDQVMFKDRQNQECIGTIEKLNPTRAKVRLNTGAIWNVHYQLLVPLHELKIKNVPILPNPQVPKILE